MKTYYDVHAANANQPRYLLSLLPIFITVIVWATSAFMGKRYVLKLVIASMVLLAFTQGGGVITHIVRSDSTWYWQNKALIDANQVIKKIAKKVVIESYPSLHR